MWAVKVSGRRSGTQASNSAGRRVGSADGPSRLGREARHIAMHVLIDISARVCEDNATRPAEAHDVAVARGAMSEALRAA